MLTVKKKSVLLQAQKKVSDNIRTMPDIIQLLPDSVANQIAAGEVIQRPASVVKELLENAVDSGATRIKLIIKDAGKTLIQVIDNGCGMSETDARLCFERHATSKIKEACDLFNIRTMGFRGEALASISSIAQVELKTKRAGEETGTSLIVEGTEVKSQEVCQFNEGTSFSVKNLFFNVPARRNFLKSNNVETSHILEEFHRVALAFPNLYLEMHHNNTEIYRLPPSPLKQRIISIFGSHYNQKLLPVKLESGICNLTGFAGKPETARKTRGEQFFFVNNRFIRHHYINHAVVSAYTDLIPGGTHPGYFIFIDIDPKQIDINIHPTKTEIKFLDDKNVYAVMKAAVRQSLGKFSATPSLDFNIQQNLDIPPLKKGETVKQPTININQNYNPFETKKNKAPSPALSLREQTNRENWEKLYSRHASNQPELPQITRQEEPVQQIINPDWENTGHHQTTRQYMQLHASYILVQVKSGIMIVDQQLAHERILFEHFIAIFEKRETLPRQQQLFPQVIELSTVDAALMKEISEDIKITGFDIDEFGAGSFVVNGIPSGMTDNNIKQVLEGLLENFRQSKNTDTQSRNIIIAKSLAKNLSLKRGKPMQQEEMVSLIDRLFACKIPHASVDGKLTVTIITLDELEKKFK